MDFQTFLATTFGFQPLFQLSSFTHIKLNSMRLLLLLLANLYQIQIQIYTHQSTVLLHFLFIYITRKLHSPAPLNTHLSIPVKAFTVEDKTVHSHGRGKNSTDPRSKYILIMELPLKTAPTSNRNALPT